MIQTSARGKEQRIISDIAARITTRLLKDLRDSTWQDTYPEAYNELVQYALDIANSVQEELNK